MGHLTGQAAFHTLEHSSCGISEMSALLVRQMLRNSHAMKLITGRFVPSQEAAVSRVQGTGEGPKQGLDTSH